MKRTIYRPSTGRSYGATCAAFESSEDGNVSSEICVHDFRALRVVPASARLSLSADVDQTFHSKAKRGRDLARHAKSRVPSHCVLLQSIPADYCSSVGLAMVVNGLCGIEQPVRRDAHDCLTEHCSARYVRPSSTFKVQISFRRMFTSHPAIGDLAANSEECFACTRAALGPVI
jgi:hypothetical protein